MTKTLTNFAFMLAALIVVVIFVTSQNYSQLIFAIALYPILIFLAFMIFPRKKLIKHVQNFAHIKPQPEPAAGNLSTSAEPTIVSDIDKRTFLKLVGATSLSFFLFSIFGRGVEQLLFGRNQQNVGMFPTGGQPTNAGGSPTDGYKISEIDESEISFFGFTNRDGAWLIMKEGSSEGTFRYSKGDKNFEQNWKNRQNLTYDYYHNLFTN